MEFSNGQVYLSGQNQAGDKDANVSLYQAYTVGMVQITGKTKCIIKGVSSLTGGSFNWAGVALGLMCLNPYRDVSFWFHYTNQPIGNGYHYYVGPLNGVMEIVLADYGLTGDISWITLACSTDDEVLATHAELWVDYIDFV